MHRWAGLVLAAFLVMAGLTGSVLAFNEDLDAWLNPDLFDAGPGPAQPIDALIAAVRRAESRAQIGMVSYPTPARGTVMLRVSGLAGFGGVLPVRPAVHAIPVPFPLHAGSRADRSMGDGRGGAALEFGLLRGALADLSPHPALSDEMVEAVADQADAQQFPAKFRPAPGRRAVCWGLLVVMAVSGVALSLRTELFQPVLSAVLPVSPDPWTQTRPAAGPPVVSFGGAAADAVAAMARSGEMRIPAFVYYVPSAGIYGVGLQAPGVGVGAGWGPDLVYVDARDGTVVRTDQAGRGRAEDLVLQVPVSPCIAGRSPG